ncbi:MAG: glycosyltransferase family A protein, partial [Candidatus Binatia bacterium]|nr:glycosyltransferase family A protein [Candidatus Binatia bacterium]
MADTLANLSCDIIIPAYQNETTLPLTLKALEAQTIPSPWQVRVLIADDGSTDRTAAVANQFTHRRKLNLAVIAGKHAGAAAARNQALSQAQAALVFFLGADIILCPGSLAAHLNWHQHHPAPSLGALGFVGWDPRLKPSPLMEWSIHGGPQNDYDSLLGKAFADPKHYFYGSHLSLKRSFLQNDQFSPVFSS